MTIHKNIASYREGIVRRVLKDGYGYVQPKDSQEQYVFSFRAIPRYRGETARELKLRPGSPVRFRTRGQQITRLEVGPEFSKFLEERGVSPDSED